VSLALPPIISGRGELIGRRKRAFTVRRRYRILLFFKSGLSLFCAAYKFSVASVEKQIAEAEVALARHWKYAVLLESSGVDTREARQLLARLEDAQLHRIHRKHLLKEAVEVMARRFEPYVTTKRAGLGSGLGLSQVYGFAGQSGRGAALASASGEGTGITPFPPRADAGPASAGEIEAEPASTPGAARILLVEDDRSVAEATQDLLHSIGFDTRLAGDGAAALAVVESDPNLALVLTDVVMPGDVNGLDLARTLRARRPELPVILVTGYSPYAPKVMAEGFPLIEKPYRRDVLAASLRWAVECRRAPT
jgi:CheY-like chemotaxis protein